MKSMKNKRQDKIRKIKEYNELYEANRILTARCCANHIRNFEETYNGQYPPSKHAPSCVNYVTKNYKLVTTAGSKFFLTEQSFNNLIIEAISKGKKPNISVEDVLMTDDQIKKIEQSTKI